MTDVYGREKRSEVMSRIRKKHTKPELAVRRALHRAGLRFRLHRADLPGVPDIVLPCLRTVVLVQGCFWHQHSCPLGKLPKSNREYWVPKLTGNRERDAENVRQLETLGWTVEVIWECEVADGKPVSRLVRRLRQRQRRLTRSLAAKSRPKGSAARGRRSSRRRG